MSHEPRDSHTPRRTVRVPDEVWSAALARAEADGTTVAEVVRRALASYVRRSSSRR